MVDGLENVTVSLYVKGMTSDIEEQIREVYNLTYQPPLFLELQNQFPVI